MSRGKERSFQVRIPIWSSEYHSVKTWYCQVSSAGLEVATYICVGAGWDHYKCYTRSKLLTTDRNPLPFKEMIFFCSVTFKHINNLKTVIQNSVSHKNSADYNMDLKVHIVRWWYYYNEVLPLWSLKPSLSIGNH